jgi:NAD(P)-dependent dehydrogenase (short-subunit alcohol dehydrogenase family)
MKLGIENKVALVTGSTAGIGLAIARSLAVEGTHVIVNGRTQERVQNAITHIRETSPNAKIEGIAADFSKKDDIKNLIKEVGAVDILVNNVGIFVPRPFEEISDEEWSQMLDINLMSGVRLSRHFFPKMIKKNWGRIIFISSESGVQIPEEMIHYGVSKTAQIALANGLAKLTKGTSVTVNTVLPGPTMSEGASNFIANLAKHAGKSNDQIEAEFFQHARPNSLLKRFATTEEVANLVTYLCSTKSSATNGAAMRVDGGTIPTI